MSGTSLDGLDLACCEFELKGSDWHYKIEKAETVAYDNCLREKIMACESSSPEYLSYMDFYLGHLFGKMAREFLQKNNIRVDFVSSHGQTIFHQPAKGYTTQIGNIGAICAETGLTVVGDFRSLDVALQGQGAPLVPIGDELLFKDSFACLNLGGFSNISFREGGKRVAYDICPVNMVLNYLCSMIGMSYDKDGATTSKGKVNTELLNTLNSLPFYKNKSRNSLGKEWVKTNIFPLIDSSPLSVQDLLATYSEHIADIVCSNIKGNTLLTGGGAHNSYLVGRLKAKTPHRLDVPDNLTIDFKEALIFAFLGLRRIRGEVNCLSSVTGATRDCCSGLVCLA